jgi:hypothetical protein
MLTKRLLFSIYDLKPCLVVPVVVIFYPHVCPVLDDAFWGVFSEFGELAFIDEFEFVLRSDKCTEYVEKPFAFCFIP